MVQPGPGTATQHPAVQQGPESICWLMQQLESQAVEHGAQAWQQSPLTGCGRSGTSGPRPSLAYQRPLAGCWAAAGMWCGSYVSRHHQLAGPQQADRLVWNPEVDEADAPHAQAPPTAFRRSGGDGW